MENKKSFRKLTHLEKNVYQQLVPIFGSNLDEEIITSSILDKSNNYEPLTEDLLLQRCLDDLLALRTFTESTVVNNNNIMEKDAAQYTCSTSSPASERGLLDSDFDSPDMVILNEKTSILKPILIEDSPASPLSLFSNDSSSFVDRQPQAEDTSDLSFSLERGGVYKVKTKLKYASPMAKALSNSPTARARVDELNRSSPIFLDTSDTSSTAGSRRKDKSGNSPDDSPPSYFDISDSEMLEFADLVESPNHFGASVSSRIQSDQYITHTSSSFGKSSKLAKSTPNVLPTARKSSAENSTQSVIGSISKSTVEASPKFSLTPPKLNIANKDYLFTRSPKSVHRVTTATVASSEKSTKLDLNSVLDKQKSSIDKQSELPQVASGTGTSRPIGGFKFMELNRSNATNLSESIEPSTQKATHLPCSKQKQSGASAAAGCRLNLNSPAKSGFSFGSYNTPGFYTAQVSPSKKSSVSATSSSSLVKPGHFRSSSVGLAYSTSSEKGAPKLDHSSSLLESPETKDLDEWLEEQKEWKELKDKDIGIPVTGKKGETAPMARVKNVSTPIPGHDRLMTSITEHNRVTTTPIPGHSSANSRKRLSDSSMSSLDISDIDELPELSQSHAATPSSVSTPAVKHRHSSGMSASMVSCPSASVNLSGYSADLSLSEELDGDDLPVFDVVKRHIDNFRVPVSTVSQPPNRGNHSNNSARGATGGSELHSLTVIDRQKDYDEMKDLYHEYKKLKKLTPFRDPNRVALAKKKYRKARASFLLKYDEKVKMGMNKANVALHAAEKRQSLVIKIKKTSDVGKAVQSGVKSSAVRHVAANIASAKIAGPKVTFGANQGQERVGPVGKSIKSAAVGKNSDAGETASAGGSYLAPGSGSSTKTTDKLTTPTETTNRVAMNSASKPAFSENTAAKPKVDIPVGAFNFGAIVNDPPYRPFSFGRDARTSAAANTEQNNSASGGNARPGTAGFQFGGNATGPGTTDFPLVGGKQGPGTAGFEFAGQAAPGAPAAKTKQKKTKVQGGLAPKQNNTGFGFGQGPGNFAFGGSAPKQNNSDLLFGQGAGNSTFGGSAPKQSNTGFGFGQGTGNDAAFNAAYDYGVAMNAPFGPGRAGNVTINAPSFGSNRGLAANLLEQGPKPKDQMVSFADDAGGANAKPPNAGGANVNPPLPVAAKADKPVVADVEVHPKDDPPPARIPDILDHPQNEVIDDVQMVQNFNEKTAKGLLEIFPKADKNFILKKLEEGHNENAIITILLEMPPEARAKETKPAAAAAASASGSKDAEKEELPDYLNSADFTVRPAYGFAASDTLKNQYLRVSVQDLNRVVNFFGGRYSHAKKCLDDSLTAANLLEEAKKPIKASGSEKPLSSIKMCLKKVNGSQTEFTCRLLKHGRQMRPGAAVNVHPELQKEIQYMKNLEKKASEAKDHKLANEINEKEYEDTDQLIECGCCYCEVAFESMIQCHEGHLFCRDCLQRYAQEAVFGQGKMDLSCMTDGCLASFPRSQLETTLSDKILHQYDNRCQEEAINLAGIDNLVKCPFCEIKAVLDVDDKVFVCPNEKCGKSSCRHCGLDWEEHFGKRCEELEKTDETKLRTTFEEKMTEAKIRTCHACKASFMKSDGCNKMTCRCKATMCYICRQPNIDYNHFCRHPRSPKKDCKICAVCSLWSNPEEDDERALQEVKKEANKARKDLGFDDDKLIGAPDEPAAKKAKYGPTPAADQVQAPIQNQPQPPRPANPVPLGAPDQQAEARQIPVVVAQAIQRRHERNEARLEELGVARERQLQHERNVARLEELVVERARLEHIEELRQGFGFGPHPRLPHLPVPENLPMNFPPIDPAQPVHRWPGNNPQDFRNHRDDHNADYYQNDDVPGYF